MKIINLQILLLIVLFLLYPAGNSLAQDPPGSSPWPRIYSHGPADGLYVALTFDDAPMPGNEQLLDILDALNVRATFFVEGIFASWRPDLLREIANRGHEIGNHTYDHPNMTKISDSERRSQLERANEIIADLVGVVPHLFRPPGGNCNPHVADVAYDEGMSTILWTVSCQDYLKPPAQQIVNHVLDDVHPGAIILLHDGVDATRQALPEIVNTLRGRGYTFVTVGEMLEMSYGSCPWDDSYAAGGCGESLPPVF